MKKITVIFAFKNRDVIRVKRCFLSLANQTNTNFDVIIVDTGSDEELSKELRATVKPFSFAKYIFNNSRGHFWNKSHAINIGIRHSKSEFILMSDIDIIFSPNVIEKLIAMASNTSVVYSSVFYLPKKFRKWDRINELQTNSMQNSGDTPIGVACLIKKTFLEDMFGLDEFYTFWGVEDRDLFLRIQNNGLQLIKLDSEKYPIFHQWHPIVSNRGVSFYPEKWIDEMNIYCELNVNKLRRNNESWGQLIEDRPIFNSKSIEYELAKFTKSDKKLQIECDIIKRLTNLLPNESLRIQLKKDKKNVLFSDIIRYLNCALRLISSPIGVDYLSNCEREKSSYLLRDIGYIVWRLIKVENLIEDYEILEDDRRLSIRLLPKQIKQK